MVGTYLTMTNRFYKSLKRIRIPIFHTEDILSSSKLAYCLCIFMLEHGHRVVAYFIRCEGRIGLCFFVCDDGLQLQRGMREVVPTRSLNKTTNAVSVIPALYQSHSSLGLELHSYGIEKVQRYFNLTLLFIFGEICFCCQTLKIHEFVLVIKLLLSIEYF